MSQIFKNCVNFGEKYSLAICKLTQIVYDLQTFICTPLHRSITLDTFHWYEDLFLYAHCCKQFCNRGLARRENVVLEYFTRTDSNTGFIKVMRHSRVSETYNLY